MTDARVLCSRSMFAARPGSADPARAARRRRLLRRSAIALAVFVGVLGYGARRSYRVPDLEVYLFDDAITALHLDTPLRHAASLAFRAKGGNATRERADSVRVMR